MKRLVGAEGPYVFDAHGRRFVDWVMGHGALLLGHRHPAITEAIREQLDGGLLLPGPTPLEEQVEAGLLRLFAHHEAAAFGKNGSDVCTAAVRIARAETGREVVLHHGYHGFHDGFVATDVSVQGIPEALRRLIYQIPFGDIETLRGIFSEHGPRIAGLIMEPLREQLPGPGYLAEARALCARSGALFILDEIVTGFRVAPGGAQELFGVQADLTCVGKALSGGMPLAALLGPRGWIARLDALRYGMTTRAEQLSLAAAAASLPLLGEPGLAPGVAEAGARLRGHFEERCRRLGIEARALGHPSMMRIQFEPSGGRGAEARLAEFAARCRQEGLWSDGTLLASAAHDDEALDLSTRALDRALEACAAQDHSAKEERGPQWRP